MKRLPLLCLVFSALTLRAERVRVVVALEAPTAGTIQSLQTERPLELQTAAHLEPWGEGSVFAVEVERGELETLRHDPRVRAVSVDEGGTGGLLESVPLIGADVVRAQGIDGRGTTIAVLDTGIDTRNPDFAGRIVAQRCFCDNFDGTGCCPGGAVESAGPGSAEDDQGHGTHVTGIAAGAGASAPPGVAPGASIVAVKVMDSENRFRGFTQIYRALAWIADQRMDVSVINMSLGSDALYLPSECGASALALGLQPVIERLRARGVLITVSTGNQQSTSRTALPACMDEVLGVGATFDAPGAHCGVNNPSADEVTCYTNSSLSMDLLAPGDSIYASRRGGGGTLMSGTSMAAPHVAGTIALLKEAGGPALSADVIRDLLTHTGKPVLDTRNQLTFPRIDARAAVAAAPPRPPGIRRRAVRP
ncbi:MAG: S8 family serine peptidase [Acidobacteriota bacterium]